jgi:hypothetical protein
MSFHKSLHGWLYLIQNDKIGFRKIGITNNLEDRMSRFNEDWYIVFVIDDKGYIISMLEQLTHAYVASKSRKLRRLLKGELRSSGHSETFSAKGSPSNKKIQKFILAALKYLHEI